MSKSALVPRPSKRMSQTGSSDGVPSITYPHATTAYGAEAVGARRVRAPPSIDARAPARASASLRPRPAPLAPAVSRTTPPARKDRLRDGPHLPQMAPCRNNGNMVCVRTTTDKIVRARSRPPAFRPALRRPLPKQLPVRYRHRLPTLCCRSIRTSPPRSPERPDVKEESTAWPSSSRACAHTRQRPLVRAPPYARRMRPAPP